MQGDPAVKVLAFIPARMAATRYPGKPLAPILGMPMVEHVYWRALLTPSLDDAWVCTCDQEIFDHMSGVGGKAVMTSDAHQRASDRMAEAVLLVEASTGERVDVAVLVQGDEPMVEPAMLDDLVKVAREDSGAGVYNLIQTIGTEEEFESPNTVKVVVDRNWNALYLSREPIPSRAKHSGTVHRWKQLGLIAFTREAILEYAHLEPTPLEVIESVDVNRLLEHGHRLRMVPTDYVTLAVDHPQDLQTVEALMAQDPWVRRYPRSGADV